MIHINLDVQDMFSERLEEFGRRAPAIALRICRTIGMSFRAFQKKNYLRGQVIGKRTGELYKSIKITNDRRSKNAVIVRPSARLANIYHKPGGATIRPKNASILKFDVDGKTVFAREVHLAARPWVPQSEAAFQWDTEIKKAADKVIDRELAKLEAKRAAG